MHAAESVALVQFRHGFQDLKAGLYNFPVVRNAMWSGVTGLMLITKTLWIYARAGSSVVPEKFL